MLKTYGYGITLNELKFSMLVVFCWLLVNEINLKIGLIAVGAASSRD
jgi:hypothetical protein